MLVILLRAALLYAISYALWHFFRSNIVRSSLHNIPGPKSDSLISGNLYKIYDPAGVPWHFAMVKKFGHAFKIHGLFGDEQVYISDPLALHHVVIKEQDVYDETSMFIAGNQVVFGHGLLGTLGETHRKQRKMLNPLFSIAHLRGLAPMFYKGAYELREALFKITGKEGTSHEINMEPFIKKTALEYIGLGGFGYSFNSFDDNVANEYRDAVKDLSRIVFSLAVLRQYLPWVMKIFSPSIRRRLIDIVPSRRLKRMRDIADALNSASQKVYEKKKADAANGIEGKDIMSVLLHANASSNAEDRLSESELLAQMNTFMFAGTDTTSSAIARVLHLLAQHPEVQTKLREEALEARENNAGLDLGYDIVMALPYLDAVVRETLRLYPPVSFLSRTTRKDASLPLSKPITTTNGAEISAIPLKNNTNVIIGIAAANRDPEIWGPDAEEWKPERWSGKGFSEVGKQKLPGVYSGMMTFLGGSRACIGFKFSQLELKVVMTMLLETFHFSLVEDKEIIWRNNSLFAPGVRGDDGCSQLPLMVTSLKTVL